MGHGSQKEVITRHDVIWTLEILNVRRGTYGTMRRDRDNA